ncbi:MAG: hypothetical protein Q7S57_04420 [bacterium]|nr:hypothetical protein [bacterium]
MTNENISVENPDDGKMLRKFIDGSERNVADLPSMYIGRGVYKPGWRWSTHAGVQTGKESAHHIGYVISGTMAVNGPTGKEEIINQGEAFELSPNHDAWVVGDVSCVALDFEVKNETQ